MGRNYGLERASQKDKDVSTAFSAGFVAGGGAATAAISILGAIFLYAIGAFH